MKAAIGQIVYFRERHVTLCENRNDPTCPPGANDFPDSQTNQQRLSPLSGLLSYGVNPTWTITANTIWNPQNRNLDNQSVTFHFQPLGTVKIFNFTYNFVRKGDVLAGDSPNSSKSNLSSTDLSFSWANFTRLNGTWTLDAKLES